MSNRTRLRALQQTAALAVLLCAVATGAAERDYRLAGIVSVGADRLLAVIEMPDGRQGLFREGDALGDGRIRAVTREGVRVHLKDGDVMLTLRGNPRLSAATPVKGGIDALVSEYTPGDADPDSRVRKQPLFYQDTVELLTTAALSAIDPGQIAEKGLPPDISKELLNSRVNEVLGVPIGATITAVDRDPVSTPQEVIDAVVPRLNDGATVRLTIAGAAEVETIELTPVDELAPIGE